MKQNRLLIKQNTSLVKVIFGIIIFYFISFNAFGQKSITLEGRKEKIERKRELIELNEEDDTKYIYFKQANIYIVFEDSVICLPKVGYLHFEMDSILLRFLETKGNQPNTRIVVYGDKYVFTAPFAISFFDRFRIIKLFFFGINSKHQFVNMNAVDGRGYIHAYSASIVPKREYKYLKKKCK